MIYLRLAWEFMQIGLFAVGGGMATLPFLQRLGERTGWFDQQLITDMIAISESTPGPIGINMATFVGYNTAGVLGGIVATLAEIIPSVIIVVLVSKSLARFSSSPYVRDAFYGLRPAVTGLIAAAVVSVFQTVVLDFDLYHVTGRLTDLISLKYLLFFALALAAIRKFKKSPVLYIALSAAVGILLKF